MKYVCLFDIDGTLLNTGGAGQRAMERALQSAFGLTNLDHDIPAAGRTDRAIIADLFAHHQIENQPEIMRRFLAAYVQHLPETLAELDGRVLPGIAELLEALAARGDVALGLLTGNFAEGALLKLKHYRLDHHFRFGGYGDVHFERDDVARAALVEACRFLDRNLSPEHLWVIGDTPSDVKCARAIGAHAVAVATGIFSYDELLATGPDHLFRDFRDPAPLLAHLL
jgi:phosphoglycolate phosphatase-like HAD superfamily hydrolase